MTFAKSSGTRVEQRKTLRRILVAPAVLILFAATLCSAQTTAFTYQGALSDGGSAANGNYDLQFSLWDSVSGGNQVGVTQTLNAIPVSNGIFSVTLDFGAGAFPGGARFLEISTRPAAALSFTLLNPRQPITATPYAIRAGSTANADNATTATNATLLGSVAANQYVQTSDSRLSDARTPTAGSAAYIQNTQNQQTANFKISGDGTAGGTLSAQLVNTTTSYNIGGKQVLRIGGTASQPDLNTFTGVGAGIANTSGTFNSFYGKDAGPNNTTGAENSFFGHYSGQSNTTGYHNSAFGAHAGVLSKTGFSNSYFGYEAGISNSTGSYDVFLGELAGLHNSSGSKNVFVGSYAGFSNETGSNLTFIGFGSRIGLSLPLSLTNATAIGSNAVVNKSNSLILGSMNDGSPDSPEDTNVGIGTPAPNARLHIATNGGNIVMGAAGCSSSFAGIGFANSLSGCANYSLLGNGTDTMINRPTGGVIAFRENNVTQMAIASGGAVSITTLGSAGSTQLCRNASNQISTCSSSLRYKKDLQPFTRGLALLNRLRPITFKWKSDNTLDLGFGAEDIAAVEPLLVTHNEKGEVEGVKYDRITAVLVNAVKEQQLQIQQQQVQIAQQQNQLANLKVVVCRRHSRAQVCK